jgi:3D (Asp-Asp-Asp) domain-containing protein
VVEVGTKKRPNTVQTALGEKLYSKSYIANISAYCPCAICCGKYTGGYTASGNKAEQYYTIAAPSNIPFGTKVYIPYFKDAPNKGIFVVQDRGGAISGNRLDIFFNEHQQALNFGRKYLKVYILE